MIEVGLSPIAVSVPEHRDDVADVLASAGGSAVEQRLFTRIFGLRHSPAWTPEELLDDRLIDVGRRALNGDRADLVLYGHTLHRQEVHLRPGFAQRLISGLGLPRTTPFFGISGVACTSVLRAVELGRDFLAARPLGRNVLVLGGDKGAAFNAGRIVPRMTVLGDAVGALTMSKSGYRYRLAGSAVRHDLRFHRGMRMDASEQKLFANASGELLLDALRDAARQAGTTSSGLDWVMPQLVNPLAWRTLATRAEIPHERVILDLLPTQGHVYGLDALTTLEHADREGRLRHGDLCALVSIGQGAFFRVLIVQVADEL